MNNVFFIGWVVLVLYVLLETDAVVKYAKLLRLKFLKYEEFEKAQQTFPVEYKHFLLSRYPNFIVNLITCQECLGIWLSIIGFALFHSHLGGWHTFGATTLGCLVGIAALKKLLKKLYE